MFSLESMWFVVSRQAAHLFDFINAMRKGKKESGEGPAAYRDLSAKLLWYKRSETLQDVPLLESNQLDNQH